jgi:hypothetical protein
LRNMRASNESRIRVASRLRLTTRIMVLGIMPSFVVSRVNLSGRPNNE